MSLPLPPVLVVDDEKNMRLSLKTVLSDEGYPALAVESAEEALSALNQEDFLMVITDARLGGMSGYELISRAHTRWPDLPILMITAYATPKLAVEAIKAGAFDYLAKPFAPEELLHAVGRCAERHRLLHQNAALRARANETYQLDQIVGDSTGIRELRQLISTVAPTDARVLVLGESGTGKEVVAGALHCLSARRNASYVRINCAAIPETLLESELFGHEKGAFTGALKQKAGRVEEADGGSIFLDEIADMSRPLQAKLLRFLEDGTFTRVGGTLELRVDVRLIAATNRDIIEAIREHEFREDLFHRLNVVQFRLPPLRDRGQDILLLAEHFLKLFGRTMKRPANRFSRAAQQKLMSHHWPGNVRELRNVIERALILETAEEIQSGSLPDFQLETGLRKAAAPKALGQETLDEMMAGFERELISSVLDQHNGNLTRTAERLKITRHALRYRMQRLNIHPDGESEEDASAGPWKGRRAMIAWNFLLGAAELTDLIPTRQSPMRETLREALIIIGVVLVISGAIFVWAAYLRKKPRRRKQHHHHIASPPSADPASPDGTAGATEDGEGGSGRRRRSRHRQRQMNRTLAETKGLPPVRDSQSPPRGL